MPTGVYIRTKPVSEQTKEKLRKPNSGQFKIGNHPITEFKKGEHFSSETKIKKGQHLSKDTEFKKGNPSPRKGIHCSEKTKQEMSESKRGKHFSTDTEFKKGIIPHNFTGGNQKYWNKQCKIRDDYTCQICGFRDEEIMIIDHILPKSMYPELKFELDNLQTLCPNCNQRKTIREKKEHNYRKLLRND